MIKMLSSRVPSRVLKQIRTLPALQSRFSSTQDGQVVTSFADTGIATISLNKAPVNSLDCNLLVASAEAIVQVNKHKDVKGIIVKSEFHGKVFSAGFNILDMYQQSLEHYIEFWTCVQDWYLAWYGSHKPVVAAITGHAPAGGCALSLMCDYRVMADDKTIGLNETKLGIAAPFFFVDLMRNAIGHRATEYALETGKMYSSKSAFELGLVDKITSLDDVIPTAEAELKNFMAVPLPAFTATKFLLRSKFLDELNNVKSKDSQNFANFISQDHVQKAIGYYLQSLKKKK